jgi:hypothetical protein
MVQVISVLGGRDWSEGRGKLASESHPDYKYPSSAFTPPIIPSFL